MAQRRAPEQDPPSALEALERQLASSGAPRAALVRGEERYFAERALALLVDAAARAGAEVCKHDAADPELSLPTLLDDLAGASLFAAARCVVVRGADALVKKQDGDHPPFVRAVLAFLASDRPGHLVLVARTLRADHALAKATKQLGGPVFDARKLWDTPPPWRPDPRNTELALWVRRRAGELDVRLSPDEAAYVAAATGNDLAALDTQLEKLRNRGGASLREVVGWDQGGNPWRAASDLLGGDLARGAAAVEALFRAGFHSDRDGKTETSATALAAILLAGLRSKARQFVMGARAAARGQDAAAAAGVGGQKQAQAELHAALALRDWQAWQRVYLEVCELEAASRKGRALEAADFVHLALRWRAEGPRRRAVGGRA
ncbi:MAG: hypothetical protein H6828_11140 [Planctomycetes bacterium]|nr:hypothetical protein [Planctomycetota bacterium]